MNEPQLSYDTQAAGHNIKIRSAIDLLLSSDFVAASEPTVQLTECSPDIDVVMNKQGGICTNCNLLFLSRSSLMSHLSKCNPKVTSNYDNTPGAYNQEPSPPTMKLYPRLVIVPNN